MHIPENLRRNVEQHPAGPAWRAGLPAQVARLTDRWQLTLEPPFASGVAAWTAPGRTRAGADVVLKISLPHEEARGEADALRHWAGRGAVRLLDHAPHDWALLLRRCRPGTHLTADHAPDDQRLRQGALVLRVLHEAAVPVHPLAGVASMRAAGDHGARVLTRTAERWAERAGGGVVVDRGVVDAAATLLRDLPRSGGRDVVVHGDLNPGNLLRTHDTPESAAADHAATHDAAPGATGTAAARGWVAIDPKPLLGDPAYDPWPLLSQVGAPFAAADPVATLRRRSHLVAEVAGLDADRVVAWSFARCVQSAYWYVAESRWVPAATQLAEAGVWGHLLR